VGVEDLSGIDPPDVLTAPFTDGPNEAEGPGVEWAREAGATIFGGGREGGREGREGEKEPGETRICVLKKG